jgi:hypothetical protein
VDDLKRGRDMAQLRYLAAALAGLVVCLILFAGCTGQKGETQPPASTLTITTRPVTPVPVTSAPVRTATTTIPVTPGVTPVWTPGSVIQAGASIQIQGDILGLRSASGNYIDEIRFTAVKAPRAEPVTFEIPNTQIIFKKSGPEFTNNYLILSGDVNGNQILEEGETFLVSIPLPPQSPQYDIYPGQKFTMVIRNPPQPDVTVATQAPPVLTDEPMVLATTSS